MDNYFIYILQSKSSKQYYIGSSKNPTKRLQEHNNGLTRATKNKGPWEIKFFQAYPTEKQAKQVEYKIKKLKRRDYIEKMIGDGFIKIIP